MLSLSLFGLAVTCALGVHVRAETAATRPARSPEIEAAYFQATRAVGDAYVTARERLLGLPLAEINSFLLQRRMGTTDPLQQLWLDALTLRLSNPQRVQADVDAILSSVGQPATQPATASRPAPGVTRPIHAAGAFANRFGPEAAALCEELLVRQVLLPDAADKKQVLILVLALQGQKRRANGEIQPVRDPRAGAVLLWVLEHENDQELLSLAAASLRRFTSDATIAAVTRLRAKATAPGRQKILSECLSGLLAEQQILRRNTTSSAPAGGQKPQPRPRPAR